MNKNSFQTMYDKMIPPKEMDERIEKNVLEYSKNQVRYRKYAYKIAIVLLFFSMVIQIQPVRAAVQKVITHFTTQITYLTQNGKERVIDMEGDYLEIKSNASTNTCKMDSISQVSAELGIPLLESNAAYEVNNCISYNPYVSGDGVLNGVMIMDDCYSIGDLENVKLGTSKYIDKDQELSYQVGEHYQSPIGIQIRIRANQDEGVDYNNHELEYAGANWNLTVEKGFYNINLYEIKTLGVNAVLYSIKSNGPEVWGVEEEKELTVAIFMFNGVEYSYYGVISQRVMTDFLETLEKGR